MGYESKLIVVEKWDGDYSTFGDTIAELNLLGMPDSFFPIEQTFECEVEKPVFVGHGTNGIEISEDCYGKKLRYTTVGKLLKVLYKCESEEHYRRTEMAINLLKTFQNANNYWDNVVVVHYGY